MSSAHAQFPNTVVEEEADDAGRKRPVAAFWVTGGILMLIHHWDEVQSNPANNGAGARESGQGADTEGRLQRPGPPPPAGAGPGGIWGESQDGGGTNPYQLIIYGLSRCWA